MACERRDLPSWLRTLVKTFPMDKDGAPEENAGLSLCQCQDEIDEV